MNNVVKDKIWMIIALVFSEKRTSVACFKWSGLKDIFYKKAQLLMTFKSLLSSFEDLVGSITMEKMSCRRQKV